MNTTNLFKSFVPFMVLLIGGSVGLTQITTLKYKFRKSQELSDEEAEEYLGKYRSQYLEELQKDQRLQKILQKDKDLAKKDWENIRGPPEDRDSRTYQQELRQKLQEQKEKSNL